MVLEIALTPRDLQDVCTEKALTPRFFRMLQISIAGKIALRGDFSEAVNQHYSEKSPYAAIFPRNAKGKIALHGDFSRGD